MTRPARLLLAVLGLLVPWAASAQDLEQGSREALPVPAITIYPGDVISEAMLTERYYPPGTSTRFPIVSAPSVLIGKVARRTLLPGRSIPQNAVAVADVVVRGTTTQAIFQAGGLIMTTLVTPLQSGAVGASVQARNLDSGQVIAGTVQEDGSIRIGLR